MKERAFDPRALDVPALCKAGARLEGQWPLMGMERLAAGFIAASDGAAAWSATGALVPVAGGEPELWLELAARADVPLACQRCLQAMTQRLEVSRRFRFVRNEDEALRLDEESEDDVLVLPARLDLHELLEDELILAQPIVPRHDVCPEPLPLPAEAPAEEDEPAPHPFAALAALRGRGGQGGGG
jgi:uncharacterized protein